MTDKNINTELDKAYKKAGNNAYFGNGFRSGVEMVLKNLEPSKTIPKDNSDIVNYDGKDYKSSKPLILFHKDNANKNIFSRAYYIHSLKIWVDSEMYCINSDIIGWIDIINLIDNEKLYK